MTESPISQPPSYLLDDPTWERLLKLIDGAAAVCYQCGVCTATCPWGLVRQETFSVRTLIRRAQLGIQNDSDSLWLCTTCSQCETLCPRGVSIAEVFRGLRYLAWERNQPLSGLPTMLWSLYWNNNPWEQPPSQRAVWARGLDVPLFDPQQHDILYYVGCSAAYETRAQKVARALVKLFNAAGVRFGILGEEEPCSGEEALSVGHKPYFRDIAHITATRLEARGVTHLVTTDPHTYDVFQNYYPSLSQPISQSTTFPNSQHYTQFLAELLDKGKLVPRALQAKITYHDPCYLARHNKEIEAPRRLLTAIPGVELVEMADNRADTLCCGGGGGRMWLETPAGERFADLRVAQALATGADILATACPYCIICLEDSLKTQGITQLAVMDIAEIAALALES
jgi:Fe-S oxidoreductase